MENLYMDGIVLAALKEDMPAGDLTSEGIIPENSVSKAVVIAEEEGIVAGLPVAKRVFELLEWNVEFQENTRDGNTVSKDEVIAELSGCTRTMLKGERTALNFLQRLSGIATVTAQYCDSV